MNMPSLNVCKTLLLIAIGAIGYEMHPVLFADKAANTSAPEEISEVIPEPELIKEEPEQTPSSKIKSHKMASQPKVPDIA